MMGMVSSSPSTARRLISQGIATQPTYGWCRGFLQANVAIVPCTLADAFEKFCTLNPSACPLLYRSKRGEVGAPPLAAHSDISFGFEEALQRAGVNLPKVDEGRSVSMYISNINCNPAPPFSAKMVVSMRSVPLKLIQGVFEATYLLDCAHGAPIHIGDPSALGIKDIEEVDFGDPTDIGENEIPVFWACGITGTKAIQSAALPQCFSHAPGCMFICDVRTEEFQKSFPSPYTNLSPRVVQISDGPEVFSVLSDKVKKKIENLEGLLLNDKGNRGVNDIYIKGDFLKSALRLYRASSVAITTGMPVFPEHPIKEETDGIPGAISIAKALCALGKDVSFVLERRNEALMNTVIQSCVESGILKQTVPVLVYTCNRHQDSEREQAALKFLYPKGTDEKPRFDHLVSIERTGPAKDGTYRTFRGISLPVELISPVEDLFQLAMKDKRIATSSIGDGGNELGMGKVKENVVKFVKNGECIACEVSSDYLISAGVSNWGGYALAVALYLLSTCPIHLRYVHHGLARPDEVLKEKECFLCSVKQEEEILKLLVREGVHDGKTGELTNSVDGLQFYPHHADQIKKLQDVI